MIILQHVQSSSICKQCSAIIIGGGPSGLASAIMLSKIGWKDIIVLEKRMNSFDSDRAFHFLIDGRGQRCVGKPWSLQPSLSQSNDPL
jgi:flavin-dependent dehydrogenase